MKNPNGPSREEVEEMQDALADREAEWRLGAARGSVAWSIEAKHPRLWKGWKPLISLYGHTRDQAWEHARKAMHYYEGVSHTRVKPLNKD